MPAESLQGDFFTVACKVAAVSHSINQQQAEPVLQIVTSAAQVMTSAPCAKVLDPIDCLAEKSLFSG